MLTKERAILQAVWLKAAEVGELPLDFRRRQDADRCRMKLYAAVKEAKAGTDSDFRLCNAVESVEIVYTETGLLVRRKELSETMQVIEAALGQRMETFTDTSVDKSFELLQAKLSGHLPADADIALSHSGEHQENPFYPKRG